MVLRAAQTSLPEGEKPISVLNNHLDSTNEELNKYRSQVKDLENRLSECLTMLDEYKGKESRQCQALQNQLKETTEKLSSLDKDQENLLLLLVHYDNKMKAYRERLVALGENVRR